MKLWDLLVISAENGLKFQSADGSMPAGCNGPRRDIDTPVRNTAHWLITFLRAYELTGKQTYQEAASRAAAYLMSSRVRPHGMNFQCRSTPGKTSANGLIGQAWVLEALATATAGLGDEQYGRLAAEVFLMHSFDEELCLWHTVEIDGTLRSINNAFNQQLWFAASGAMILASGIHDKTIASRVEMFLHNVHKNMFVHRNGLIGHQIFTLRRGDGLFAKVKDIYRDARQIATRRYRDQSAGYHSFNLYAWAMLKSSGWLSDDRLRKDRTFKRSLGYAVTAAFRRAIRDNPYAFSYNPTGFEVAFALETFADILPAPPGLIDTLIVEQISRHYSFPDGLLNRATHDPETLSARIYEIVRLANRDVPVQER